MKLTVNFITELAALKKPKKYGDGNGLYLYVLPSGTKYWRFRYYIDGREKTLSIGNYPRISLIAAREKVDDAKQLLLYGTDPFEYKQEQVFERIARDWFERERISWKERHALLVIHSLETDVFPFIGKKDISLIKTPEILMVIRHIEKRGALQIAVKVLQRLQAIFRYAVQIGRITVNPATDLVGIVKTKKVRNRIVINKDDLSAFIKEIIDYSGMEAVRDAILLMMLTFVRTDELRKAKWTEFDSLSSRWHIPAARMKKDLDHIVPLSSQSITLLKKMALNTRQVGYIFKGRDRNKPISHNAMLKVLYRKGYKGTATIHGLRGLASTIMNESGDFTVDVIERQLSHVDGNAVRRAYNHAQYLRERTDMMQWWGDYLEGKGLNIQ